MEGWGEVELSSGVGRFAGEGSGRFPQFFMFLRVVVISSVCHPGGSRGAKGLVVFLRWRGETEAQGLLMGTGWGGGGDCIPFSLPT